MIGGPITSGRRGRPYSHQTACRPFAAMHRSIPVSRGLERHRRRVMRFSRNKCGTTKIEVCPDKQRVVSSSTLRLISLFDCGHSQPQVELRCNVPQWDRKSP